MSGELIIPKFVSARASTEQEETASDNEMETESHTTEEAEDGGIGLDDDGKSGKLTLSILLSEKLIEPGDGVMSIDYLGQTFKGEQISQESEYFTHCLLQETSWPSGRSGPWRPG